MALRIAVVGVGFGTTVHVPALQSEGLEVVALVARRRERAVAAAKEFGIPAVFTEFADLLEMPGLDAVSIASPPGLHKDMAIAALRAGKHVICEKPFALDATEGKEMLEAAETTGLTAMVAHEFRFSSARMRTKELIDEGYVGVPQLALVRMLRGPAQAAPSEPPEYSEGRDSAAAGAGMLFALGSHFIDGLRHWFGEVVAVDGSVLTVSPERVRGGLQAKADADDTFLCTLRFASGVTAEIVASRAVAFGETTEITVHGTEGVLITPQQALNPPAHGTLLGARRGVDSAPGPLPMPERLQPFVDDRDDRLMPFRLLVREFCRGIDEGCSPGPNFRDGYRCQQVLDAIRESSLTGGRMAIDG